MFIKKALRARSRDVRHARMRRLADEAMADPGFVADMREVSEAFAAAQADEWPTTNPISGGHMGRFRTGNSSPRSKT